jgi:hypothetical protein
MVFSFHRAARSSGFRHPFLHDAQVGSDGHLRQGDRHPHLAGRAGVIEPVGVANGRVRCQLEILAADGMALAGGEVRERHAESASHLRVEVVHLAGEAVRRNPFDRCVRVEERPVHALRRRPEHAVQPDGVGGHGYLRRAVSKSAVTGSPSP